MARKEDVGLLGLGVKLRSQLLNKTWVLTRKQYTQKSSNSGWMLICWVKLSLLMTMKYKWLVGREGVVPHGYATV